MSVSGAQAAAFFVTLLVLVPFGGSETTKAARSLSLLLDTRLSPIGRRRPAPSAPRSYGVLIFELFQCRWINGETRLCRI